MSKDNPLNLDPIYDLPSFMGSDGVTYDQGDTCANAFTMHYCAPRIKGDARPFFDYLLLTSKSGWPRRSPDENKWYGREGRCSRDQFTPVLAYATSADKFMFKDLIKLAASHRYLFANNTVRNFVYETEAEHKAKSTPDVPWNPRWKIPDLLGPDVWSMFIRGMVNHYAKKAGAVAYIPLCILDIHGLLAAINKYLDHNPDHDQRNLAIKTHLAAKIYPTFVSKLAYKIYKASNSDAQFKSWWSQPGEPNLYPYVSNLYKEQK